MKKIWSFILCLVISLTMTSVCLASDGADLNKQQQAVVKVFAALNGQNGMEYAGIRQLMSAKLQTELDEKTFGSVKIICAAATASSAKTGSWPISGMLTATAWLIWLNTVRRKLCCLYSFSISRTI